MIHPYFEVFRLFLMDSSSIKLSEPKYTKKIMDIPIFMGLAAKLGLS